MSATPCRSLYAAGLQSGLATADRKYQTRPGYQSGFSQSLPSRRQCWRAAGAARILFLCGGRIDSCVNWLISFGKNRLLARVEFTTDATYDKPTNRTAQVLLLNGVPQNNIFFV